MVPARQIFFNGKEHQKTRILYPHRSPKIPVKEGRTQNAPKKEFLAAEKKKKTRNSKEKTKERKDSPKNLFGLFLTFYLARQK